MTITLGRRASAAGAAADSGTSVARARRMWFAMGVPVVEGSQVSRPRVAVRVYREGKRPQPPALSVPGTRRAARNKVRAARTWIFRSYSAPACLPLGFLGGGLLDGPDAAELLAGP